MPNPTLATGHARLGLPGLPDLMDSLAAGGIYLLLADTASARLPVLSASLAHALGIGMNCRLLLPQHPEPLIAQLQSFGNLDINQAIRAHKLALFTVQDELCAKMSRYGAEAFVQELAHFAFPDGSYLVFDQADALLALHDVAIALNQLEVLKKWALQHRITFLLTWTRAPVAQADTLSPVLEQFKGVARLHTQGASLALSFDHWQSDETLVAEKSVHLLALDSGLYRAVNSPAAQDDTPTPPRTYQVQARSTNERMPSESPDMRLDFDSEDMLFDYEDDTDILVFGKNDAPRAKRARPHT